MREIFDPEIFENIKNQIKKSQPLNPYIEKSLIEENINRQIFSIVTDQNFKLELQNGNISILKVNTLSSELDFSVYLNDFLENGLKELFTIKIGDQIFLVLHENNHDAVIKMTKSMRKFDNNNKQNKAIEYGKTIKSNLILLNELILKLSKSVY